MKLFNVDWLDALHSTYVGEYKKAHAVLKLYLSDPQAVGDHTSLFEDIDKYVGRMAELKNKIDILQGVLRNHEAGKEAEKAAEQAKIESQRKRQAAIQSELEGAQKKPEPKKSPKPKRTKKST